MSPVTLCQWYWHQHFNINCTYLWKEIMKAATSYLHKTVRNNNKFISTSTCTSIHLITALSLPPEELFSRVPAWYRIPWSRCHSTALLCRVGNRRLCQSVLLLFHILQATYSLWNLAFFPVRENVYSKYPFSRHIGGGLYRVFFLWFFWNLLLFV